MLEIFVCSESLEKNLTSYCDLPRYDVGDRVLLSRKKRFLTFPRGSAFTVSFNFNSGGFQFFLAEEEIHDSKK